MFGLIVKELHPARAIRAPGAGVLWWAPAGLLATSID
jgi:hypothetical protein